MSDVATKTTRAQPAPPKQMKQSFLPDEAKGEDVLAADNMRVIKKPKKGDPNIVGMTFNMDKNWHRDFKMAAVDRGIDMRQLLIECFALWVREQRKK